MRIRDANVSDRAAIVRIYNHAVVHSTATFDTEPFTVESRLPWFEKHDAHNPLIVAEIERTVAGYANYVSYRPKPGYAATVETSAYIDPDHQRRGIAAALYEEIIARAQHAGVHAMIAVIDHNNAASVKLHQRLGFEEVGRLREVGRKFGAWIDTLFFEKIL